MNTTQTFNITLNIQDIQILGNILSEGPYKLVAPLIAKINLQISEQTEEAPP